MANNRKHIFSYCPIFYPHMGGAERTVFELYKRLSHSFDIHLHTPIISQDSLRLEFLEGFRVYRFGKIKYTSRVLKILSYQFHLIKRFICLHKKMRFSAIHVHYAFHSIIFIPFVKIFYSDVKIILTEFHLGTGTDISSPDENGDLVNYICGLIYKLSDSILTISNDNFSYIKTTSSRSDTVIIKQGADHLYFNPSKRDTQSVNFDQNRKFILTSTSRISPRKNIEDLIRLTSILIHNYKLKVIFLHNGTPEKNQNEYFASLVQLAKDLDVVQYFKFNGFVPDDALAKTYANADLFILCSRYEGFGLANAEALSSGTPVVTYNTMAARDYILDEKNGYVIDENTPEAMAVIVAKILSSPSLLSNMSKQARKDVEEELNWDQYAIKHYKIFNSILSSPDIN